MIDHQGVIQVSLGKSLSGAGAGSVFDRQSIYDVYRDRPEVIDHFQRAGPANPSA
jgi:hypothetical protein